MVENEIIKKVIGHGSLEFQNGELKVWSIPSVLMPIHTYVILEMEICNRFGDDAKDLLYYLAKYQAYGGTNILHKQYGFKELRKVVDLELQTCALMGMGELRLVRYDEKRKVAIVRFSPNPSARIRKALYGLSKTPTDHFGRGGMAGIFSYAFNEDMVGIETMCEHTGKAHCTIEIRKKDSWNLNDSLVKQQFPKPERYYKSILGRLTASSMRKK